MQQDQSFRYGRNGRPVQVYTNSFAITRLPNVAFYQYHVITQLDPVKGRKIMQAGQRYTEIIEKMQDQHSQDFQPRASYDGMSNLYRTQRLDRLTFPVHMARDPKSDRGVFEVQLSYAATIEQEAFTNLIRSSGGPAAPQNADIAPVNLLQILISQAPHIRHKYHAYAKSFYLKNSRTTSIGPGLIMLAGFFQSVRPVVGRFVINIDTTSATFYQSGELMGLAMDVLRVRDVRGLSDACATPHGLRELRSFLRGVYVMPFGSNRKVAIRDIEPRAGSYSFDKGGAQTTVYEHYEHHHNRQLRYPNAPGVRTTTGAVFPFELCTVIEGQRYKKKLSPRQAADFIKGSAKAPHVRMSEIERAVGPQELGYANAPHLAQVGMTVESRPLQITGRQLDPPDVHYGDSTERVSQGKWNMVRRRLRRPANITSWAVVACIPVGGGMGPVIDKFIADLTRNMETLGIRFERKTPLKRTANVNDLITDLDKIAWDTTEGLPPVAGNDGKPERQKPSLIVVLLPEDAGPLRRAVKRWGDHIRGVPTQCLRGGKWENSNDQYRNNVVLKINARCGGVNSVVNTDVMSILEKSLVIGCDVSHPAPGVRDRPSIASLVASMDANGTRYWAHACCQAPRQEMIDKIGYMLLGALHERRKRGDKAPPDNIIIYRDGVSEGEYVTVVNNEISQIRQTIQQNYPGYRPNLLFIVVTKRHHVRFFPMDRSQGDRTGNCHPGLVVDRDIVHPQYPDFWLLSQAGLLGTSRPSHYVVLANDAGFAIDNIQALSYQLCFVYAPATRSVSIPAPVYYADRVCTRAAETAFQEEGSEGMPAYEASDANSSPQWDDEMLARWNKAMRPNVLSSRMYFV